MIGMDILQPVVALLAWTMVMWLWMYAVRLPALTASGLKPDDARNTKALDEKLPAKTQWPAHNYNHLHEAPTLFYAVAIVLAIIGQGDGFNTVLAWAYVTLRIAHSIVQATINKVALRFALYALSTIVLMVLIFHAAIPVFDIHI
ncbi:MAPEG family protein [Erythrobacter dokdonensis]|uniref:MAPEG domain-containing protein n=1 Tax=Erythrobacter dokdonensis DSW-74 TaxID=1300349 RepID=A0A1A7BGT4_9SPHN|nr:MAPEG family protein [Erythrobacter dokdonensis]OBV11763.1 MAPEG domain-containing protein [Erythrobacter dokdonensis DSW-74]